MTKWRPRSTSCSAKSSRASSPRSMSLSARSTKSSGLGVMASHCSIGCETYHERRRRELAERIMRRADEIVAAIEAVPVTAPRSVTVRKIIRATAVEYGVSIELLLSRRRLAVPLRARQVAMYLARRFTLLSTPNLGRLFDGRDHSTLRSNAMRIERRLAADAVLAAEVQNVIDRLIREQTGGRDLHTPDLRALQTIRSADAEVRRDHPRVDAGNVLSQIDQAQCR